VPVTLTYPDLWSPDPVQWKSDLDAFLKRLLRLNPNFSAIWRLEPQERGAPHYHLLIYQKSGKRPFLPHEWVSKSWAKITNGNPESCSRVEALKSHRGGMFYAAKYCAKLGDGSLPDGWEHVGKHWGKFNADCLPFPPQYEMLMHSAMEQAAALFAMADAYKAAFINSVAKENEGPGIDASTAHHIAECEWKAMKEENEYLGNTTAFFGSAEQFFDRMSRKMMELEFRLSKLTGRRRDFAARMVDVALASV
jgi:hypothetical protein